MTRDTLFRALAALAFVSFCVWLISATEWADDTSYTPARGEAAKNPFYAVQGLLRGLGAQVVRRQALDAMPPQQATLVLDSRHWRLFPERAARLRQWVEQGGRLVLPASLLNDDALKEWVPVSLEPVSRPAVKDEIARTPRPRAGNCTAVSEPDNVAPAYTDGRDFMLCQGFSASTLATSRTFSWQVGGAGTVPLARVPVGRGSVTVIAPWQILRNNELFKSDNALLAMAALQAGQGAQVWFVVEEARAPILIWLWQSGWAAVLLSLAALAAALWRGAVRFGPLAGGTSNVRRSMAEQVSGTGQFLMRHGAPALHRAQVRAMDEAARRHLRNYKGLDVAASLEAISRATGLDATALARAIEPKPAPAELARHLELLETARRRLQMAEPGAASRSSPLSPKA